MKIVYLVASSDISGGQRVIFQQAEGLAKQNIDVTLVCHEPPPTWFSIQHAKWETSPFSESEAIQKSDIRVATYWPTVPAAVHSFNGPVFHLCQGYEADLSFNRPFLNEIEAAYAHKTTKLTVSPHLTTRLKSVGHPQVFYVGQTFDANEFPPKRIRNFHSNQPAILLAGIFEADVKGIRETLEALSRMHAAGAPFRLHRISTWSQSTEEKNIFSAHIYDLRLMPGEIARAYRESDILIGPSHPEEGFGLHVLEGLSSGLPALLSDTPAHRHIAADAADYFRWGDPKDILRKLKRLLVNPIRLQQLSRMGPVAAAGFSTKKVVNRLIKLFSRSLDGKKFDAR